MSYTLLAPDTADGGPGTTYWEPVGGPTLLSVLSDNSDATAAQFKLYSSSLADRLWTTYTFSIGPSVGALVESVTWIARHGMQGITPDTGVFTLGTPYGSQVVTTFRASIRDTSFVTTAPPGTEAKDFATGYYIDQPPEATVDDVRYIYRTQIGVTWFNPPQLLVNGPTGTETTTSTPTLLWQFIVQEKPQTLIEVRVYEQSTTQAPGFTPGQTSGLVYGRDLTTEVTSHTLEQGIPNAIYVGYVRTRQQVNGVEQLSTWQSTTWTQNIAPPTLPAVPTFTVDQSLGQVRVSVVAPSTSSPAVSRMELQRRIEPSEATEPDGEWETVDGNVQLTPGATGRFWDYQIPDGWDYTFRVRTVAVVSGVEFVSAWSTSSTQTADWTWTEGHYWLKRTDNHTDAVQGQMVLLLAAQNAIPDNPRARLFGRHVILGRPDPVVTFDALQLADGLSFVALSFVERAGNPPDQRSRQEIDELLANDVVFYLHALESSGERSRYVVVTGFDRQRFDDAKEGEPTRLEVFTLTETGRPDYPAGVVVEQ